MSSEESSSKDATVIDDDLVAALGFEPSVRSVDPGDSVLVAADEFDDTFDDGDVAHHASTTNGAVLDASTSHESSLDDTAVDDTSLDETVVDESAADEFALDESAADEAAVDGPDATELDEAEDVDKVSLADDADHLEDEPIVDEADAGLLDLDEPDDTADIDEAADEAELAAVDEPPVDDADADDDADLEVDGHDATLDALDAPTLVDADLIDLTDPAEEPVRDDDEAIASVFAEPDTLEPDTFGDGVDTGDGTDAGDDTALADDGAGREDLGLDLVTAGAATTAVGATTAATQLDEQPTKQRRRTAMRARKSRRVVRHVDPWSVLTFSVLFHLCFFAALLLASVLVWRAADAAGTIGNAESFIMELGDYESFEINGDVVFRSALLIAGMLTLASSIMVVLLTVVFNLISDLIGGIRVTVLEEETVRIPAKASRRTK